MAYSTGMSIPISPVEGFHGTEKCSDNEKPAMASACANAMPVPIHRIAPAMSELFQIAMRQ